jgi:hypothetical protein
VNATEAGNLLGLMALYDNRTTGDADIVAWLQVIGDLDYADARAAVLAHYGGESTERIMPGHVRAGVRKIRSERIARAVIPAPPAELADDPRAYQRALQESTRRAADGALPAPPPRLAIVGPVLPEIEAPREDSQPQPLRDAMSALRRKLGPARARQAPLASPQEIARRKAAESRAEREAHEQYLRDLRQRRAGDAPEGSETA